MGLKPKVPLTSGFRNLQQPHFPLLQIAPVAHFGLGPDWGDLELCAGGDASGSWSA